MSETALVTSMKAAVAKVEALLAAGVHVAIDDFGTGYGSMSYVQLFHPSKIKIDRSFVICLSDDVSAQAIVQASITLARAIGASVVAEGPDTEEQVRYLQESGCSTAQGYWFSRPADLERLMSLLEEGALALPLSDGRRGPEMKPSGAVIPSPLGTEPKQRSGPDRLAG